MGIFTLVNWTFGFLATPARTKDEIRLDFVSNGTVNVLSNILCISELTEKRGC